MLICRELFVDFRLRGFLHSSQSLLTLEREGKGELGRHAKQIRQPSGCLPACSATAWLSLPATFLFAKIRNRIRPRIYHFAYQATGRMTRNRSYREAKARESMAASVTRLLASHPRISTW